MGESQFGEEGSGCNVLLVNLSDSMYDVKGCDDDSDRSFGVANP